MIYASRICATLLLVTLAPATFAQARSEPTPSAGHHAVAIYTSKPKQFYRSEGQSNKLLAATNAKNACLQANPTQSPESGYCELIRLDEQTLTTVADIRGRIPKFAHPLFLWRYQSGNAVVYLGGSIHILKPGLYPLPRQFQQAFDLAERLVLEVNLAAYTPQQLQFKATQYGMLAAPQKLSEVMPAETYKDLAAVTAQYGLPLEQLAGFKPSFITQQLAVLALLAVGYDPSQGVETFFTQQASDKEILELETIDLQLDLLMNQPLNTQVSMVNDTIEQMDEFEPLTAGLVTAWLAGDDDAFIEIFEAQSGTSPESKAFLEQLMDQRNIGMADKIAGYLKTEGSYFVLAGAAHYIGDNSIIKLLERKGFKGQRIYTDQNITQ